MLGRPPKGAHGPSVLKNTSFLLSQTRLYYMVIRNNMSVMPSVMMIRRHIRDLLALNYDQMPIFSVGKTDETC